MKYNNIIKFNSKKFLISMFQYMFILCVIANTRSILVHNISMKYMSNLVMVLMGISVVGGSFAKRNFSYKNIINSIILILISLLFMAIFYIFDPLKNASFIKLTLQLMAIIAYCRFVEETTYDTLHKYCNVVTIIAVISLIFWIFASILNILKPSGTIYTTWSGSDTPKIVYNYYYLYFETQKDNFFGLISNRIWRNSAIFTEGPMASFVFSIAFTFSYLCEEKINIKKCILLAISIITTTSTIGLTCLIMSIGLRFIFKKNKNKSQITLKVLFLPIVSIFSILILIYFVESKLGSSSGSIRLDDFVAGYRAWMDNPILGNGYGNASSYKQYMSSFRNYNMGFSNSVMEILAYGGIYLFMPYFLATFVGVISLYKRKEYFLLSFYIIFVYSFIITYLPFQMLPIYLFISLFKEGDFLTLHYANVYNHQDLYNSKMHLRNF